MKKYKIIAASVMQKVMLGKTLNGKIMRKPIEV
jgi:hypothetical protein